MVGCLVIAHNIKYVLYRYKIEDCDVEGGGGGGGAISYSGLSYNGKIQNMRPWKSTSLIPQPIHGHNLEPIPTISHHCKRFPMIRLNATHTSPFKSWNQSFNMLN